MAEPAKQLNDADLLYQRELALEEESIQESINNYKQKLVTLKQKTEVTDRFGQKKLKQLTLSDLPPGIMLLHKVIKPYIEAIKEFKKDDPFRRSGNLLNIRKFLCKFSDEEIAFIAARRIIASLGTEDEPVQRLAIAIARMLQDHLNDKNFQMACPGYYNKITTKSQSHDANHKRTVQTHSRHKIQRRHKEFIEQFPNTAKVIDFKPLEEEVWSKDEQLHIGTKLIHLFIEKTGCAEKVGRTGISKIGKVYCLQPTPDLQKYLQDAHFRSGFLEPLLMPMVVPPVDWKTIDDGGYLKNQVTRKYKIVKETHGSKKMLERLANRSMPAVYSAINNLQSTPYRINTEVFKVMKELWKSNSSIGGLPTFDEEPLPIKPWGEMDGKEFRQYKKLHEQEVKEWKHQAAAIYERRARIRSKRIALAIKLDIAEKFLNDEAIYFTWQMDWRGRLYPQQLFLNPQADDTGTSLLEFAEGCPLGNHGVKWLKIHLANEMEKDPVTKQSLDKLSFEDRIKWVEAHEDFILDCAYYPLDGSRYWSYAENPYNFLAACYEYAGYKQEGESFISHLPIGVDGSCNGLQNFSALLRDEVGGKATNLIPQEVPADVYVEVLEKVKSRVEADSNLIHIIAKIAKNWIGKLDRKLVKRGVMTYVYGSKESGMKDQILAELNKRNAEAIKNKQPKYLDGDDFKESLYLGKILYESIGEVVIAAAEGMKWLQQIAVICSKAKIPIKWVTPAGFEVLQDYKKTISKRIQTFWGGIRIPLSIQEQTNELDSMKQRNAISPNFIHSLDASHLMLTVNESFKQGITSFSAVHDKFGTHAGKLDLLSVILREEFIKQYSTNVLEQFRTEIINQLPDEGWVKQIKKNKTPITKEQVVPKCPKMGSLDLNIIRDSKYFFA